MWKLPPRFAASALLYALISVGPSHADESPETATSHGASLCNEEEYVVLSAQVRALNVRSEPVGPPKLVSLCADRPTEPFSALAYRFGEVGAPDITIWATRADKFRIADVNDGPHVGEDIVWFERGPFSYYISEFTGQARGVDVYVFKNGARIADFSTIPDETKFFNDVPINFDRVKSPIFMKQNPHDQLE